MQQKYVGNILAIWHEDSSQNFLTNFRVSYKFTADVRLTTEQNIPPTNQPTEQLWIRDRDGEYTAIQLSLISSHLK